MPLYLPSQPGRGQAPGLPGHRSRDPFRAHRRCEIPVEGRRDFVEAEQCCQPVSGFGGIGQHVGQRAVPLAGGRAAVLATEVHQQLPAKAQLVEPPRVLLDLLACRSDLGRHIRQFGREGHKPFGRSRERAPPVDRAAGGGQCVEGATLFGQRQRRSSGAVAVPDGVGQCTLLVVEPVVLVCGIERGAVELVDLESQKVDLAGACTSVAPELRHLSVQLPHVLAGGLEPLQVDVAEAVERVALNARPQQ